MSQSDRDLLELAARAAGLTVEATGPNDWMKKKPNHPDDPWLWWNPLTDDGDALRLAVKLGMFSDIDGFRKFQAFYSDEIRRDEKPTAATRRAITIIAAEIGRAM